MAEPFPTQQDMPMKIESREPAVVDWSGVLLVCKVCRKRGNGPKKDLKTKAVVAAARRLLRQSKPRPRVLTTSCMGLCPKAAVAVARVGGGGQSRIGAVTSIAEVERLLPLLEA